MYYIFGGDNYYPIGGANDFLFKIESFGSQDDLIWEINQRYPESSFDWINVADENMKTVLNLFNKDNKFVCIEKVI